ncbi:MAG: hypothetical protein LDL41_20325 [Coleofasciculus sp. S288]|nr:hypothetical protein [Coleofasciculus sp. S288]
MLRPAKPIINTPGHGRIETATRLSARRTSCAAVSEAGRDRALLPGTDKSRSRQVAKTLREVTRKAQS